ncbi:hypothetical protein ZWY2020_034432 [Hordeum vulgare]|nr:hypothetical protein ZWY2020_034432 [Hordeum vulgare]
MQFFPRRACTRRSKTPPSSSRSWLWATDAATTLLVSICLKEGVAIVLKPHISYSKILKDLKKEFCCNGTVVQDIELGQVIQLQGDQRKNVSNFLVQKEHIKIHGF